MGMAGRCRRTSAPPVRALEVLSIQSYVCSSAAVSPGRVLARSSGAVPNALDRLTALGDAQLTTDKPRRYRHQAAPGTTLAPGAASASG
jgi:hypothetical protein